jgi:uncharacterized protein (UPF0332 family)
VIDPQSAAAGFLKRAEEALQDAEILLEKKRSEGSINRSYYAAFYGACALLDSIGLKARSHQAAIDLLHREYVHPGKLDRELMLAYTRLFEARMSGDYGLSSLATLNVARHSFATAGRFLAVVRALFDKE